jgi:hypothetical protein
VTRRLTSHARARAGHFALQLGAPRRREQNSLALGRDVFRRRGDGDARGDAGLRDTRVLAETAGFFFSSSSGKEVSSCTISARSSKRSASARTESALFLENAASSLAASRSRSAATRRFVSTSTISRAAASENKTDSRAVFVSASAAALAF